MKLYSTRNKGRYFSLKEAVFSGIAPDNGLFVPQTIPALPARFFEEMGSRSLQELAADVAAALIGDEISKGEISRIINEAITFDLPLIQLDGRISVLELFHGPTLAFKDFGARFMSGLLSFFAKNLKEKLVVLAATSGDTGSAVASSFLGNDLIEVFILYPSGKVSEVQEKQFTTLGGNVTALEVQGNFDDCQRLVKEAFADREIISRITLTSANSINIARLIPQTFYYFYGWSRLADKSDAIFSVPSGNLGNLTAGLIAKRMGLPIKKFVAATNANDTFIRYLRSGLFQPAASKECISNAMDVGNPSNLERIRDLYNDDRSALAEDLAGFSFTDDQTRSAISELYTHFGYISDPHGAVGYLGLKEYLKGKSGARGVFLETAHPAKFREAVEPFINKPVEIPSSLRENLIREKVSVKIAPDLSELKSQLLP